MSIGILGPPRPRVWGKWPTGSVYGNHSIPVMKHGWGIGSCVCWEGRVDSCSEVAAEAGFALVSRVRPVLQRRALDRKLL